MTLKQVSKESGPYQVAEIFREEWKDGVSVEISEGFVVLLPGFGAVSTVFSGQPSATDEAVTMNREFIEWLSLSRPLHTCPVPDDVEEESFAGFDDAMEKLLSNVQLTRKNVPLTTNTTGAKEPSGGVGVQNTALSRRRLRRR
jgi:hypothetical protein